MTLWPHSRTYIWRKTWSKKIHAPQYSLQHCLQQPRHGSNLNIYWQRMDEEDVVHLYNGILLRESQGWGDWWAAVYGVAQSRTRLKRLSSSSSILLRHWKEWINDICSKINGPSNCHTEWSKSHREREIVYYIPSMWNLKRNDTNKLICKRETDSQT